MEGRESASREDFSFGDWLGNGSFCQVVQCTDTRTSKKYAAKQVAKRGTGVDQAIVMEAHCLRKLEASPCIAMLFCEFHGPADWLGVLELCEGGELWEEIKHCGCLSEAEMAWFASQMVEAIATVHDHGIAHRDIKCENFLLTLPEKTVKLIDFGTARDTENPEVKTMMLGPQYEHHVGTPNFMAPEAVDGKANDRRSDLWSLGCAFSQMLLGVPPFHAATPFLILAKAQAGNIWLPDRGLGDPHKDLVLRLLQKGPDDRLGAAGTREILGHPALSAPPLVYPTLPPVAGALRLIGKATIAEVDTALAADEAPEGPGAVASHSVPGLATEKLLEELPKCSQAADIVGKLVEIVKLVKEKGLSADLGPELAREAEQSQADELGDCLLALQRFGEVAQQRWKDIKEEVKFPDANSDSDDEEEEEEKKKEAQDVNPKASTNTEGVVPTGSALKGKWSTYAQLAKSVTNVIEEPKKQCCALM